MCLLIPLLQNKDGLSKVVQRAFFLQRDYILGFAGSLKLLPRRTILNFVGHVFFLEKEFRRMSSSYREGLSLVL